MAEIVTRTPEAKVTYHAIFSGVIVALALELLLTLLGNAIGISLTTPQTATGIRALTVGPVLWTLGIPMFCFFVGGFVAAFAAGANATGSALLHGFLVWGLGVLFLVALWAVSSMSAAAGANHAISGGAFWLVFFSACLSLFGALCGGYFGSQPLHRSLYRRHILERREV